VSISVDYFPYNRVCYFIFTHFIAPPHKYDTYHIIRQDGFKSGLKNAFEYFINLKHNSSASLIAKYVDRKLKGEKGITEQEVEQALDQVKIIVMFLYFFSEKQSMYLFFLSPCSLNHKYTPFAPLAHL